MVKKQNEDSLGFYIEIGCAVSELWLLRTFYRFTEEKYDMLLFYSNITRLKMKTTVRRI